MREMVMLNVMVKFGSLGLRVIAEGMETEQHLSILQDQHSAMRFKDTSLAHPSPPTF